MLNLNLHRQTMLLILKEIYSQPSLASSLGFKGGTAVYLLYNLPRFSVDLDFDLLNPEKETVVFEGLKKILTKFGNLEEATKKYYTLFYLLSYQIGLQKLKIEISRRPSHSHYEMKQFAGISFLAMVKEDMFANKLIALTERRELANRDLFDIHFFLNNRWPLNADLVEKHTGMKLSAYLQKCVKVVEAVSSDGILAHMGELIDGKTKIWMKTHFKADLLTLLKIYLTSLPV